MTFVVKTYVDDKAIVERIKKDVSTKQAKLDAQVLKDSNFYAPMDTGTLIKSGIIHTVLGSGLVQWETPYVREQYYERPEKSHQKNPSASMKWFEVAKSKRLKNWKRLINAQ